MDSFDRAILGILQQDSSLPLNEIANRVGLSPTPCWNRIRKMEELGIITGRVALLDAAQLGLGVTVFVSIETSDHSEGWLSRFAAAITTMPEVVDVYRMSGDVDYMLRVVVPGIDAYDGFYRRLIKVVPLKNVSSRFAMEKVKATTALPLDDSPVFKSRKKAQK
ncbi:MAG: Lrp/AsnC family transcriptional regulator [Methylobacterium sp.]|jgi:Lrp/AsnC family transcriptional regulator|nr:Lrp/AsnC family transcriptional regulator [Methylobacterium sp.]MCA3635205.1 Lrp/AsnC family transcriptional regulator [Methylobacterium sp.]MCA3638166.1 Lrp/AsnC family transcriptional regulator [Methylobacterium sp.]MCA3642985.1 Lrp/AsnC family transcriptional regulator [Methylobacterium sp.]MCZ8271131.1 Lrp/AsnC family transcriptional regulator [Beijerinckiaceae bacterium]